MALGLATLLAGSPYGGGPAPSTECAFVFFPLYRRQGRVLRTIAGPFPQADLVAIAESLAPAGS